MKIQIMEFYKETFHNVRAHKKEWARVASGPVLVWALGFLILTIAFISGGHHLELHKMLGGGMMEMKEVREGTFFLGFAHVFYNITYFIAMTSLYINGYRYAVLQEGGESTLFLNLNMRFVKFVLYTFFVGILVVIYVGISVGIIMGSHALVGNIGVNVILGILLALYGFYLMFRIILFPVSISIDQSEPIKTSWRLMKGNILRFLGLSILIALTIFLIGIIGSIIVGLLGLLLALISPAVGLASGIVLGMFLVLFLVLLGWAVNSKMMGLVYQALSTQDNA